MSRPLSPAAQAVLDAYETAPLHHDHRMADRLGLAAALRALAVRIQGADAIRQDVFDIAGELEAEVDG